MISLMVIAGLISLGFILLMFKMGLRKVLGYDIYVDVALTVLLAVLMGGSFDGIVIALISGLILSVVLLVLRKFIGFERFEDYQYDDGRIDTIWVRYSGWIA